jgi:signal transduction histidine kinase
MTTTDLDRLFAHQHEVLEMVSRAAPLQETLTTIVLALEELLGDARCTVLLLDPATRTLHQGAAPTVSPAYQRAVEGMEVGPCAGSCGTAVHLGTTVVAADVTTDPRWVPFRDAALAAGLRSGWSHPIRGRADEVIGTFAVYHADVHRPSPRERDLVARYTDLAAVAIEHARLVGDLVAREVAQREAEVARETAERHSRAKTEFLAAVADELRTPVQAITGFAELLGSLDLDDRRRREALRRIELSARDVLCQLEDVVDISLVEADALPLEPEPVVVGEVVAEVTRLVHEEATRNRVGVRDETGRTTIVADRRRLQQVLLHLVTDAVRQGRAGGQVRVTAGPTDGDVRIDVAADGPGIPSELPPRAFQPFRHRDPGAGRGHDVEGFGIGLVVSHALASAMGGGVEMSDSPGQGTVMRLTLPAAARGGP